MMKTEGQENGVRRSNLAHHVRRMCRDDQTSEGLLSTCNDPIKEMWPWTPPLCCASMTIRRP
jgi:hypothetical protein